MVELAKRAHGNHCQDHILESIEAKMGANRKEWIEGQSIGFEAALRPLFAVLPHTPTGGLTANAARYALHRVFVDARGWNVNGLEESKLYALSLAQNGPAELPPLHRILQGEVPQEVESAFEKCSADMGVQELALLAATLDELVHQEVLQQVKAVFKAKKLPMFGHIDDQQLQKVLEQVMIGYICDAAGIVSPEREKYIDGKLDIKEKYPSWLNLQNFLHSIQEVVLPTQATRVDFEDLTNVIKELNEHYGRWQNGECQVLSQELRQLESECPGHVPLRDFYSSHFSRGNWQFTESVAYLRSLGALEESQREKPKLISTNYVLGANNCVATSKYYSQCCLNQCDGHLRTLEKAVAKSEVAPDDLQAAVKAVLPEPDMPALVSKKLVEISQKPGQAGRVALHGLPFAEWLHHAYPRECPAPKIHNLPEELPGHFETRNGKSPAFSDEDMEAYLKKLPEVDRDQECHIAWTEEPVETWTMESPVESRRLLEVTAPFSSLWVCACVGMLLGGLVASRFTSKNPQASNESQETMTA